MSRIELKLIETEKVLLNLTINYFVSHVMFSGRPLMLRDPPPASHRHIKDKTDVMLTSL